MDFAIDLLISINQKKDSYNLILIIIDWLIKIIYYKLVKVMIDAFGLVEVIINVVLRHHSLSNFIITNQRLLFTSKY